MSILVTITSFTANTPIDFYYCDSFSANCVFAGSTSVIPYQFSVPSPYDEDDLVLKLIDSQSCEVIKIVPYSEISV
jgi:hypothetical protein